MPKDTKTLGNSKARACESLGFVHKKGCARVLTHLLIFSSDACEFIIRYVFSTFYGSPVKVCGVVPATFTRWCF